MVRKILLTICLLVSFCFISVSVKADDSSNLKDTPYFNCNSDIIYKSTTGTLTISEIKDLVLNYAEYDNTLELSIELLKDTYTGNGNKIGEYDICYNLYYSNEEYTQSTIVNLKIKVVESFPGDYYFNGWLYTRQALSKEQLLKTLQTCDVIPNVDLNIVFTSEYFDLSDEDKLNQGIYYGSYSYSSTTGYSADGTFKLNILESLNSDISYTAPGVDYGLLIGIITCFLIVGIIAFILFLIKRKIVK